MTNIEDFNDFTSQIGCEMSELGWWSMGEQGQSDGDVHFRGFNRQSFDFNGIPNKLYCLLSDYYIQINALFSGWNGTNATTMRKIGVKTGNRKCGFTCIEMDREGVCKINKIKLESESYFPLGIENIHGDVKFTDKFAGYDMTLPGIEHAGTFQNACLEINVGYYSLRLLRSSEPVSCENANPYFVNLVTDLRDIDGVAKRTMPHGVLGQTVDKDRLSPEGNEEDYEVSSLFANDFKFNRFNLD